MIEVKVEAVAEELHVEYDGCGSHKVRLTLTMDDGDAVSLFRSVALALKPVSVPSDMRRWLADVLKEGER